LRFGKVVGETFGIDPIWLTVRAAVALRRGGAFCELPPNP